MRHGSALLPLPLTVTSLMPANACKAVSTSPAVALKLSVPVVSEPKARVNVPPVTLSSRKTC